MNPQEIQQFLKQPTSCEKLKKILDRKSDHCFTDKESETFELLVEYIIDKANPLLERARAVYIYDEMMGSIDISVWELLGVEKYIEDFIRDIFN